MFLNSSILTYFAPSEIPRIHFSSYFIFTFPILRLYNKLQFYEKTGDMENQHEYK